ncbi:MAG: hypothetical protein GY827_11925 [Cytophagales bacterium]|nr:hypothetical protein [Cytophagales bacterium]
MKKILLSYFLFLSLVTFSQVGPYSNGTLVSPTEESVSPKSLELQFGADAYFSRSQWADNRELETSDTTTVNSSLSLQFNSGITEDLEWGVILPIDASSVMAGLKYRFLRKDSTRRLGMAIGAWTEFGLGNRSYNHTIRTDDNTPSLGASLIASYRFSDKWVMYSDVSSIHTRETNHLFANAEILYAVKEGHHWITSLSYSNMNVGEEGNSDLVAWSVGPVLELWDNWNVTIFTTVELYGKNTTRGFYHAVVFCTIF